MVMFRMQVISCYVRVTFMCCKSYLMYYLCYRLLLDEHKHLTSTGYYEQFRQLTPREHMARSCQGLKQHINQMESRILQQQQQLLEQLWTLPRSSTWVQESAPMVTYEEEVLEVEASVLPGNCALTMDSYMDSVLSLLLCLDVFPFLRSIAFL
jgi:hypothetical protein